MSAAGAIAGMPTMRKVLNRGWTPIQWRSRDGYRFGWMMERKRTRGRCRFPGDERPRWLPLAEIKEMSA